MINGIKAISFDGDETLWDFQTAMRASLKRALEELERIDPEAAAVLDIEKMVKIRNRVALDLKGRAPNLEEVRLEAFRETLKDVGRPDDALAMRLNEIYLEHRFKDTSLFDDVLPTLEALQPSYTLGLISNGNTYPKHCGLEGMFQFVVFAQDCGVEKPNPEIFRIAIERAGFKSEELLHVGDSVEDDVTGALAAGVKCVWLNRIGAIRPANLDERCEISSLLELLEILPAN